MGNFSKRIRSAQSREFVTKRTERVFSALITLFVLFINDLESKGEYPTPELIDAKITELDSEWQKYCEENKQFLTADAYKILREEISNLIEETKRRILAQGGSEGTLTISKN